MKQTKFFIAIGAAILSVAGFLVTKAGNKFLAVSHANFTGIPIAVTLNAVGHLTTVKSAGSRTLWIATRNGIGAATNLHLAVTVTNQAVQVYYK